MMLNIRTDYCKAIIGDIIVEITNVAVRAVRKSRSCIHSKIIRCREAAAYSARARALCHLSQLG
jgi:hypothetical protein